MSGRRSPRPWLVGLVVALVALAAVVVALQRSRHADQPTGCQIDAGATSYPLDLAQASNAATVSAVALRLGLSDHAVTVALATALQESKLHNVDYGDRDSVGLFQQRPSQGWGPRARILDTHYAAGAFYARLVKVRGWQTMTVADAAQAVQRSAEGAAYARWEPEARAIARAFTGEVSHGVACHYGTSASSSRGLTAALRRDVGTGVTAVPVPAKSGWRTASWLVAQSAQYDVDAVSFAGQRWTRTSGHWHAAHVAQVVTYSVRAPS